jgi:hypothetical protein
MLATTLEEYAKIVLSITDLCNREKSRNPKSYKHLHSWYLYRQAFYGFIEYIGSSDYLVSQRALEEYKKNDHVGNIKNRKWSEQHKFDEGRKIFHLEHIYTGDMFREALDSLSENNRTSENIAQIIQDNYRVAWILKEENKLLPRSNRGQTLEDAMKIYSEHGISLI